jgi:hypothetical protein
MRCFLKNISVRNLMRSNGWGKPKSGSNSPFLKDIFALKMRICWATRWSLIRIICCLLTARNSDSNQTFPVTKQNTLALIIGMKLSSPDSTYPKVDFLEAWKSSLQFFRSQFEQWHWWFFYKSVIGHGSILCLIQKKLPDLECIFEHKAYPFPLHWQKCLLIYCMLYLGMWYSSFLFFSSILFHR